MIVSYDDLEICEIELTSECGAGCPQCPRNIFGGETVKDLPICELSLEDIKLEVMSLLGRCLGRLIFLIFRFTI